MTIGIVTITVTATATVAFFVNFNLRAGINFNLTKFKFRYSVGKVSERVSAIVEWNKIESATVTVSLYELW